MSGVLDCMGEVLNWSFRPSRGASSMMGSQHVTLAPTSVRPGSRWQDVLLAPALMDTMFEASTCLRHMHSERLPVQSRQVIIQVNDYAATLEPLGRAHSAAPLCDPCGRYHHVLCMHHACCHVPACNSHLFAMRCRTCGAA